MKTGLKLALELIKTRQLEYEQSRDSAVAQKNYGSAAGFEGIAVGLMIAGKIVQSEIDRKGGK
jgi:hypothetical protein